MVAELVHEDIRRPRAVGGHRRIQVEDTAASISLPVRQDLDDVVRRLARQIAKRAVVERQDVALGPERVVGRANRRPPVHAGRRAGNTRRPGRRTQSPDVEVGLARLERLVREQDVDQAFGVALELGPVGGRVAITQDQQIDLGSRVAVPQEFQHRPGRRRRGPIDEDVGRVDEQRPHLAKRVPCVPFLQHDLHGSGRHREAQRLLERASRRLGLPRRFPLAVNRREAARVDDAVARAVDDLEQVLAEIRVVHRPRRVARPRRRLDDDAVEREHLGRCGAGVVVVDAEGARGLRVNERGTEQHQRQRPQPRCREAAMPRRLAGRYSTFPSRPSWLRGVAPSRLCTRDSSWLRGFAASRLYASLHTRYRVNFRYLIRCGRSASAPSRRFLSAS